MSIKTFRDKGSEDICHGVASKLARKCLPPELHPKALIKLARIAAASQLKDLSELRGNRFEILKSDRAGQCSIRVNDQYRICFRWEGADAYDVEITDYH